jgi:hypothetical protein
MANYAPDGTLELRRRIWDELTALSRRPDLLASFIRHAEIPVPLQQSSR